MRVVGLIGLAAVALMLAGCMTAEERRAADEGRCRSYGFRPNTDAFAECLQRLDLFRRAEFRDDGFDPWDGPVVVYRSMRAPPHSASTQPAARSSLKAPRSSALD
jgi:hypothetical protein